MLCLTVVVFVFSATAVLAANFSLSPATGNYATQNNFVVSIEVNTDQAINGVEGSLSFPTNKLEVIGLDKSHSVMSIWVQEPSFSNSGTQGSIHFSAIKLNPGFVGSKGNVLNITFKVKDAGVANLTFSSGSILANDGKGSNILNAFGSGVYSLVAKNLQSTTPAATTPSVTPAGQPTASGPTSAKAVWLAPQIKLWLQDSSGNDILFNTSDDTPKWSNNAYAKITWDKITDNATKVLTLLDDNPETEPSNQSATADNWQILPFLNEGKHYFHIRWAGAGGGATLHFPIFVDLHEPKHFTINFDGETTAKGGIHSTSNPRPRLTFFTEDELAGLDRYQFKINDGDWSEVKLEPDGTFILPKLSTETRYNLVIRAFDLAGNFTDEATAFIIQPIVAPQITYCPRTVSSTVGPLVIEGKAAPEAKIELVLDKHEPLVITAKADQNGDWRVVYNEVLPAGTYSVKARQILDNGAESSYSPAFTLRANSWQGKIINWLANYYWYLIVILFIAIQVVMLAWYRRALQRLRNKG